MKVYVATSWKNELHAAVVERLRAEGHEVYDFKHPAPGDNGFAWREIVPDIRAVSAAEFRDLVLTHPAAERGFKFDMDALNAAEATVLVQPCGNSAHLELGRASGAGQLTVVLLADGAQPELMYKMCDHLCTTLDEVVRVLATAAPRA